MQVRVDHLTPCCGQQPTLDTWDKDEARSVFCPECGRSTGPHFERHYAYIEWEAMFVPSKILDVVGEKRLDGSEKKRQVMKAYHERIRKDTP